MGDHQEAVLGATEGAAADIAWVVIYVLCLLLMVAPFVLWYADVRTPRTERRARRDRDRVTTEADTIEPDAPAEELTA
jgi:hypothetical protein